MRPLVRVTYNGQAFSAYPGDIILDAALRSGVGLPHDCRSGDCDACIVRVVAGRTQGGEAATAGTIRACEARALTDLELVANEAPRATSVPGRIEAIAPLSDTVIEVAVRPGRSLAIEPGQHVELELAGYPPRAFWATAPLDARAAGGLLHFHVKLGEEGGVSQAFGRAVLPGHAVTVAGPFGDARFRRGAAGRLVLVSHGVGFARIWAIADAALRERPGRSLLVIVGVEALRDLYMVQSLDLMASCPNVRVLVTSEEPQSVTPVILPGRPVDYLPALLPRDVVYAAGPGEMVDTVRQLAAISGAEFHGECLEAAAEPDARARGWLDRLLWPLAGLTRSGRQPEAEPVRSKAALPPLPASELARRFRAETPSARQ